MLNCIFSGVNVKTGEIFPATFSDKGPEQALRSAHHLTGGQQVCSELIMATLYVGFLHICLCSLVVGYKQLACFCFVFVCFWQLAINNWMVVQLFIWEIQTSFSSPELLSWSSLNTGNVSDNWNRSQSVTSQVFLDFSEFLRISEFDVENIFFRYFGYQCRQQALGN